MKSLAVFCGASSGHKAVYREAAEQFGRLLAERDIELVWGAGNVGLMGVVADAVIAHGGRAWGAIPDFMVTRELAHPKAQEVLITANMHERKAAMAARADAFVALPGGFGTLDELFEILTWAQLGLHQKPIALLNVEGFFTPLLQLVRHMCDEGFVRPQNLDLFSLHDEPAALITHLQNLHA
ncbi:TIGR00730 family Rossman fold protein [Uliginosibacterium sediminicola]|uniref:Cytokinin riboside 5'-monophosphate phosphoribohydrolase n=1 Tax=Uliginosibacterium sediminicola TaxID=2024550 RepID=A0ABU9Z3Q7_9RHOO